MEARISAGGITPFSALTPPYPVHILHSRSTYPVLTEYISCPHGVHILSSRSTYPVLTKYISCPHGVHIHYSRSTYPVLIEYISCPRGSHGRHHMFSCSMRNRTSPISSTLDARVGYIDEQISARGEPVIFVGYATNQLGFLLWCPERFL